ncbi:MAG: phage protein Gp36 family protein [Acidobacteriota bacterium]
MPRFLDATGLYASKGRERVLALVAALPEEAQAAAVESAVTRAEDLFLSIVTSRYASDDLPATPAATHPLIAGQVADVAFHRLEADHSDLTSEAAESVRSQAVAHWRDVAAGRANLVLPGRPPVDDTRADVYVEPRQPTRVFDREGLLRDVVRI